MPQSAKATISPVDLHMHSRYSDGSLDVPDLVRRAFGRGVRLMALTDHDNTAGLAAAASATRECGMVFLPGVEVSCQWNGVGLHVVGLGIDAGCPVLQEGLGKIMAFRDWRATEIGRRLAEGGMPGAEEGARSMAGSRMVGRMHFARWLVQGEFCSDTAQAFELFLGSGRAAYVPSDWIPLPEAVSWIRAAGGLPVLAHPGRYRLSNPRLRALLSEFRDMEGAGLEVCSGSQGAGDREYLGRLARELSLAGSVGSDFHGPAYGHTDIGQLLPLPEGVEPVWERACLNLGSLAAASH